MKFKLNGYDVNISVRNENGDEDSLYWFLMDFLLVCYDAAEYNEERGLEGTRDFYLRVARELSNVMDKIRKGELKEEKTEEPEHVLDRRMFELCLDNVYRNNLPIQLKFYRRTPDDAEFAEIVSYMKEHFPNYDEYETAMIYAIHGMCFFR